MYHKPYLLVIAIYDAAVKLRELDPYQEKFYQVPRGFYWHRDSVRKVLWRFYGRRDPSSMVSRGFDGGWDNSTKLFCRNLHQTLETSYWKGRDVHKSAIKPSLHCRDVSKSLKAPVKFVEVVWSSSRSFNAVSYVSLWVWRPLWHVGINRF